MPSNSITFPSKPLPFQDVKRLERGSKYQWLSPPQGVPAPRLQQRLDAHAPRVQRGRRQPRALVVAEGARGLGVLLRHVRLLRHLQLRHGPPTVEAPRKMPSNKRERHSSPIDTFKYKHTSDDTNTYTYHTDEVLRKCFLSKSREHFRVLGEETVACTASCLAGPSPESLSPHVLCPSQCQAGRSPQTARSTCEVTQQHII